MESTGTILSANIISDTKALVSSAKCSLKISNSQYEAFDYR